MKFTSFCLLASTLSVSQAFVPHKLSFASPSSLTTRHVSVETNGEVSSSSTTTPSITVAQAPKIAQRWRKSTKQVITLGPASSNREMIEKLFLAGADVFRLNFSHGSQEQKKELLITIREVEEQYSHPIAILGDLQGPKLRVRTYNLLLCLSSDWQLFYR
jgi:pyruvate kinase